MPEIIDDIKIYSLPEVADILKVSIVTLRDWIKKGKLKAKKIGKAYKVTNEELKRIITA